MIFTSKLALRIVNTKKLFYFLFFRSEDEVDNLKLDFNSTLKCMVRWSLLFGIVVSFKLEDNDTNYQL